MPQIGYAHRQAPMGREGMVASCHPLASLAGVEVLKGGGTVADAAVATNAVLAVTQPNYCGVGGDLFCLYYEAATRRVHFLNGAGRSGERAGLDELSRRGLPAVPMAGPGSVSVPGVTRAWTMLLERFGSRSLQSLLEPAVHYARDGFPISDIVCQAIRERAAAIDDAEWHRVFVPGGAFPRAGECFRQPDLARTLAALGQDADLFYRGHVARAIADRLAAEGFLTAADLAAHQGEWSEPISTTYRGYTVYETPPPTQGVAALLSLNLLEGFDVAALTPHSAAHLHLLIEVSKLAYADRDRWVADPDKARVPIQALLEKGYAARRRMAFAPDKAQDHQWGDVDGGTTGFVVADGRGNVLSVIQSIYKSFGSDGGGAGDRRGAPEPRRRTSTRTPPIPTRSRQASARSTRCSRASSPATARRWPATRRWAATARRCSTPRRSPTSSTTAWRCRRPSSAPGSCAGRSIPETCATVCGSSRACRAAVRTALGRRGHQVETVSEWYARMGHAHGVSVDDGTLRGGADPRGDGAAIGY